MYLIIRHLYSPLWKNPTVDSDGASYRRGGQVVSTINHNSFLAIKPHILWFYFNPMNIFGILESLIYQLSTYYSHNFNLKKMMLMKNLKFPMITFGILFDFQTYILAYFEYIIRYRLLLWLFVVISVNSFAEFIEKRTITLPPPRGGVREWQRGGCPLMCRRGAGGIDFPLP